MLSRLGPSRAALFCFALSSFFTIGPAYGQFTTILNIPPDPDIGDRQSIGSDTQLNLSDGGAIGFRFDAGASDGTSTNVEVNISGGSVGHRFDARSGSTVNISGGSVGDSFFARGGSAVNLSGGEFRLDGMLLAGLDTVGNTLPFNLPDGSVFSGTLADGTPFAISSVDFDNIADGTLTLEAAALPPIGPAVITLPSDPVPLGVRAGQTLLVNNGGVVADNFNAGLGTIPLK